MIPIWRDTYYTSSADTVNYEIRTSGETIFSGRAYKAPDEDELRIKLNDVCSNYLKQPFPITESDLSGGTVSRWLVGEEAGCVKEFELVDGENTESYVFYYDYSYADPLTENLTIPYLANTHAAEGMFAMDVSTDFNDEIYEIEYTNDPSIFRMYGYESGYCGDYAIYYTNRFGAWSSYLCEGGVTEKDLFSTSDYVRVIDNGRMMDRAKTRFNNTITHTYEIKTGWMGDHASRMFAEHLLSSNNVWLHDLRAKRIVPVVITDSEVVYKVFHNERKPFGYVVNLEESNKKVIK